MKNAIAELDDFFKCLAEMAEPVGFSAAKELPEVKDSSTPRGARLYESAYALLLVCVFPEEHEEELAVEDWVVDAVEAADLWLDKLLREHEEGNSPTMDGYFLLVLPEPPNSKLRERIREIELDPSFFRRQVVWPEGGDWQRQLEKVTVLALRATPSPAKPAEIPALPDNAEEAWKMRQDGESIAAIERAILSEVGFNDEEAADEDGHVDA